MLSKNLRGPLWLALALGIFSFAILPAHATIATGHASATILQAITLVEQRHLDFGEIAVTSAGGSVTISAAGAVSGPAAYSFSGSPTVGRFTVTGQPNTAVTIAFSSGNTLAGPGTAMSLESFTHDAGVLPSLNSGGNLTFAVGATLVINANQATGNYSGAYSVTVDY